MGLIKREVLNRIQEIIGKISVLVKRKDQLKKELAQKYEEEIYYELVS